MIMQLNSDPLVHCSGMPSTLDVQQSSANNPKTTTTTHKLLFCWLGMVDPGLLAI